MFRAREHVVLPVAIDDPQVPAGAVGDVEAAGRPARELHRRRAAQRPTLRPVRIDRRQRAARAPRRRTVRAATTLRRATAPSSRALAAAPTTYNRAAVERRAVAPGSVVARRGRRVAVGSTKTLRTLTARCARAGPVSRAENTTAASPQADGHPHEREPGSPPHRPVRREHGLPRTLARGHGVRDLRLAQCPLELVHRSSNATASASSAAAQAGVHGAAREVEHRRRSRPACSRAGGAGRRPPGAPGRACASAATTSSPRPRRRWLGAGDVRRRAGLAAAARAPAAQSIARLTTIRCSHGPNGRRRSKRSQRAQRRQERLLGDVLGGRRVVHDEPGRPVGARPVAAEELVDRVRRPAPGRRGRAQASARRLSGRPMRSLPATASCTAPTLLSPDRREAGRARGDLRPRHITRARAARAKTRNETR